MIKLRIKAQKTTNGGYFFIVTSDSITPIAFETFEGARIYAEKKLKRARKEASAYAMLQGISINLLSFKDMDLALKLLKNKCAGISPRQYGYLKGIYDRQQREW